MQFVIVTGMSGAGKSTVLKILEDLDFFCVDNLPPTLIPKFAEICANPSAPIEKVAMGIDIRGGSHFSDFLSEIMSINDKGYQFSILFLDATDDVLLMRYKETRRIHPLARNDRLMAGIEKERELMLMVKQRATYIIDTSYILTRELKTKITEIFVDNKSFDSLMITILSFGYKYGIPEDSDLVFDVRFIPNPFYLPDLKPQTGNDEPVRDYVMSFEVSQVFIEKLIEMVTFLIPNYVAEGKNQLVISIGCTGGKHRSVTLANALGQSLNTQGHSVIVSHRDIEKDTKRQ